MGYRSAIVDELGYLVAWCCDLDEDEENKILNEHPEYSITCLECGCDGYAWFQ